MAGNTEVRLLIEQLQTVYGGNPWYGQGVLKKLNMLDQTAIESDPPSDIHSIPQLVAHMIAWRRFIIHKLQGDGEWGDVKSQFVFHGDVLYTTQLIEKQCDKLEQQLLISSTLMEKLSLPKLYQMHFCGKLEQESGLDLPDLYTVVKRDQSAPA